MLEAVSDDQRVQYGMKGLMFTIFEGSEKGRGRGKQWHNPAKRAPSCERQCYQEVKKQVHDYESLNIRLH